MKRVVVGAAFALFACHEPAALPEGERSGGSSTVYDTTRDAFSLPVEWLNEEHRRAFFVGNSLFNQNWVSAPSSVSARDGLGPLFNARSCSGCHFKDGRGQPPAAGEEMVSMLLRVSAANARGPLGAPVSDRLFGEQLQNQALPGLKAEARVTVSYEELPGAYADGERYVLKKPRYHVTGTGFGKIPENLQISPRVAPALVGLGPLEAVPEALLLSLSDPEDRDRDGISGRVNRVPDLRTKTLALGRFGWKAEQPNVFQQSAAAFAGDMGLTSALFPEADAAPDESAMKALPNGGTPEVEDSQLHAVAIYSRALGVPARRSHDDAIVNSGEELFVKARCTACHVPTLETGALPDMPELPREEFHPYTDLLLHDLGEGLSDGRPVFEADGREWRTPPLWGIGLVEKVNGHRRFLHDGRAHDLAEAILWHGGEAENSKRAFVNMNAAERRALIAFLNSL